LDIGGRESMMGFNLYYKALVFALALLLAPAAVAQAQKQGAAASPPPPPPSCNRNAFRPLVDVGHTLEEPGALSARGVTEYDFNLNLAKVIEQKLSAAGFGRTVLLVTSGPAMKGLFERVRNANAMQADLFLAIHHDSVPDLFMENWDYDGKPNHFSDRFSGHSLFVSFDNPQIKASLLFGKFLGNQLKTRGLEFTRHYTEAFMGSRRRELLDKDAGVYRYDKLIVLRETTMPAVLLEAGMIVNRNDELVLASQERRELIAAAVTDAVVQFCDWKEAERLKALALARKQKKAGKSAAKSAPTAR
jgi:N-acetylmuramoyl-L-alanine amidase